MSSHEISDAEVVTDSIGGVTDAIRDLTTKGTEQLVALTEEVHGLTSTVDYLLDELRELKRFLITNQRVGARRRNFP